MFCWKQLNKNPKSAEKLKWAIFWVVTWDALWVPYEFKSAEEIAEIWEIKMIDGGSWSQPIWAWSDDSSLTLCLLESLANWYNLKDIAEKFILWKNNKIWNASDYVFDMWLNTSRWIDDLIRIFEEGDFECLKYLKNDENIYSNGNGSLMRILPLLWEIRWKSLKQQFEQIHEVSALTHPHTISAIACFIYLKIGEKILEWKEKNEAYQETRKEVKEFIVSKKINPEFREEFANILDEDIKTIHKKSLISSWYVVKSLEVVLYCFLKYDSYKDIVIESIKFWWDTDTAAAIWWGLAGLYYGFENIPKEWLQKIRKYNEIEKCISNYQKIC